MNLNLPTAPSQYDVNNEAQTRTKIEQADAFNIKKSAIQEKFFMRDTVTGTVVTITVASGSLVVT